MGMRSGDRQSGFSALLRRIPAFALSFIFIFSALGFTADAAGYDFPEGSASVSVTLDGVEILKDRSAIINSTTYIPLRDASEIIGAESISWDAKTQTATVKKGKTVLKVKNKGNYLEAAGRYFYTPAGVLNIDGRLFVPVRPFAAIFCLDLYWNGATRTVELTETGRELTSGPNYYDSDDLYWLSRIISAEAAGESLLGQIAVGNVVLNRVESRSYPNTIYGVIFDRKGGTQFSPVSMGTIYKTPTASSVMAAKICLEGYSVSDRILFFMNPRIATNNWISKNRPYAFSIGNHDFYY